MLSLALTQEALQCIPPQDRQIWLKMAMAIKSEFGNAGRDVWETWSQQADNYKPLDAAHVWRSIKGGDIGIGTLIHEAKLYGWKRDLSQHAPMSLVERDKINIMRAESSRLAQIEVLERQKVATAKAQKVWKDSCLPNLNHPYLKAKQVKPINIRQIADSLVVPLLENRVIVNLQFIKPNGTKRFLSGGKVKGCYALVGDVIPGQTLYICEGWATAVSIYADQGHAVACAMHASNLLHVGQHLRVEYPKSTLVIAGDNDRLSELNGKGNTGVDAATNAAAILQCGMVLPAFPLDAPLELSDFNDLACWRTR